MLLYTSVCLFVCLCTEYFKKDFHESLWMGLWTWTKPLNFG